MGIVITVSRQLGSQGSYMAADAARELGYRYVDREILQRAAEAAGYPDELMVETLTEKERIPGLLERMLDALGRMAPVPAIPSATLREGQTYVEIVNETVASELRAQRARIRAAERYGELVKQVIQRYAETGEVVIAGRGGQAILRHRRNALHVRVVASKETRVRALMARLELTREAVEAQVEESDRDRARYLRHYHGVDVNDPQLYHIILNADDMPVGLGTHIIAQAGRWLSAFSETS
jgi:cytidylate kinase